ncbi:MULTISPECIES: LysR family transcriptional regulator [Pseudomonas]|uniref:LysR family transcriptional regulator n=1 Tax=Pseudomonas soli TaxID=1306993 RepID=A0AAJ5MPM1_9PSED|nr:MULTISPECIES: LysR family transcriptional regulator [Pseudomonas]MDW9405301.1 LysR family transcriptional regulator [Pseudomonas soli]PYC45712.1 LysR family transcriptional regulator [Pseudomonas soli]UXZ47921.1 LysR family transcriptional regulator [Pseudomonas soli]
MMDLRRLRCFLVVSEELHFGRAAARLHMAQPPLTRQISALETELGFRLFDRSTRNVSLTTAGRHLLPYARGVLEQVDLTTVITSKLAAGSAGQLTVGYASSIALSDTFSHTIQAFCSKYPDVQLNVEEGASSTQWTQLIEGRLDIGMSRMHPPGDNPQVQAICLDNEPLVAAVPSDSPLAGQLQVNLAELGELPLITFPADYGSGLNEIILGLYRRHGLTPRPAPSGRQITSIIALVAAGRGVAVVPQCTRSLVRRGVSYLPLAEPGACAPLLVLTRRHERSPLVRAFVEVIEQTLRSGQSG